MDALVRGGPHSSLRGLTGVWELDLEGDRVWSLRVDDGYLTAHEGPEPGAAPNTSLHMRADAFLRVASGAEHENLLTAVLRGELRIEGDLRFAQHLDALLPLQEPDSDEGGAT